jgi:hypothetical protein
MGRCEVVQPQIQGTLVREPKFRFHFPSRLAALFGRRWTWLLPQNYLPFALLTNLCPMTDEKRGGDGMILELNTDQ